MSFNSIIEESKQYSLPGSNSYKDGRSDVNIDVPLQFVPGHVVSVMLYSPWPDVNYIGDWATPLYDKDRVVNAIKAVKHGGNTILSKNIEAMASEVYYPLMRGIADVPTQGDQVLLCKFGGVNYYMGPINTTNSPNYNIDHLYRQDDVDEVVLNSSSEISPKQRYNLNPDFSWQPNIKRLQKKVRLSDASAVSDDSKNPNPVTRGVGDLIFEGRYGNSIRLGNRFGYPNLFISNGRNIDNFEESMGDSSLIFMTTNGSFKNYFDYDFNISSNIAINSNSNEKQKRLIKFDTEYSNPQMILSSNRLILNSRSDNVIISSNKDIEIGSGNKVKIYSNKETIIESKNIYLGEVIWLSRIHCSSRFS